MPAPDSIRQLVEKFKENYAAYHAEKYNEAQLRQEFVDKFFEALGWDVYNKNGVAPDYRDVVVEDSLEIDGGSKAPDYAFKIGKERKFYVEAKKPKVDIQYDIHPAYQLKRYAWNAHMPLSILTDFEELAVYNCKNKPNPGDSAATGRDLFFRYTDYVERWDEIAGLFSKEAVWKGAFDQFAETTKGKKGTTGVDDAILDDIENWRKLLALNIALRNPQVADEHQLNYAVQMTIDRILFLRICEDRGIEPEEQLKGIAKTAGIYPQLVDLFRRADLKYNSGLFHFNKEKGNDGDPDSFTPGLKIDDKVLKEIIGSIYYPCPYIFKEIPVEILGQVYEQFLGRVVRLTAGHQARIEEKPEVRKAGGVYYTPKYIVDYIVQNTVGKLLEGKTPAEAADLKIVDPACGSGSFLLGAFQHLIDWHEQWYNENEPEKWARGKSPALLPAGGGGWKLTTAKKKEILVNNIYGVDIDAQAVEVTKLSLLLKVLEEESGQLSLGLERALPDLGNNIRCGNSLIDEDYFEGRLVLEEKELRSVNPFEWKRAFPQVFTRGGFDAVIGNPPYVRQETLGQQKEYFQHHYQTYHGMADLYTYFIEKGVNLLRPGGRFSYIVANKWMRANYGAPLRNWLRKQGLEEIIDFGDLPVFEQATTYPCILSITNQSPNEIIHVTQVKNLNFPNLAEYTSLNKYHVDVASMYEDGWSLSNPTESQIISKLSSKSVLLGNYVQNKIYYGIKTALNDAFVIDSLLYKEIIKKEPQSFELLKPFLMGRDIKRYQTPASERYLILIPKGWTNHHKPGMKNAWNWFQNSYPALAAHLLPFADAAQKRQDKGDYWWELRACDYYDAFEKPKFLLPDISLRGNFMLDAEGKFFCVNTAYIISSEDRYLLGILNSNLTTYLYKKISSSYRGGYLRFIYQYLIQLPIRKIDFNDPADVKRHDRMVALVEAMLALHKQHSVANTPHEKELLQRQIASTDRQIDALVYELYGLTEEEIKIVEGGE